MSTVAEAVVDVPNMARARVIQSHELCAVSQPAAPQNVGTAERFASMAGGAAIAMWGLSHGKLLGLLATGTGAALLYRGVTGHCHCYDVLGVNTAQRKMNTAVPAQEGVHIAKSVTINRDAGELYQFWRSVENLPQVMQHVATVERLDDRRSRWTAEGPLDMHLTWEAEIFNERDGELIAWRSLPGGDVETAGSIRFEPLPGGRGIAVHLNMKYNPPAGKLADRVASLFGQGLAQQIAADLLRFKSLMEAGELPPTNGQTSGRL
jgi:uncharacterized membrane protein